MSISNPAQREESVPAVRTGREGRFTMPGFRQRELEDDYARDKLKEFMEVAEELSEAWTPVLDQDYPFSKSFHEVVRDLIQWHGIVQSQTRR